MAESGHDYLEILPDEAEVAMNRPLVEIPLLGTDSGKYLRGHANRSFTRATDNVLFCLSVHQLLILGLAVVWVFDNCKSFIHFIVFKM